MKNNRKISTLSIVCVLCTTALTSASAAPSVRALGGAGTYDSASSAASARTGATPTTVRAGSVRATPSTGGTASKNTNTGSAASGSSVRAASNPYSARLSIGRYLNSGKTVSGGSSIKDQNPGSSNSGNNNSGSSGSTDFQDQIDTMRKTLDALHVADEERYTITETDSLLGNKQDILVPGNGIEIKDGVITAVTVEGKQVLLQSDGNSIQWKYADDATWQDLVMLADLAGPEGPQGPQGEPGSAADLTDYPNNAAMSAAILNAIDTAALNYATAAQGLLAETALQEADMSDYAKTVDVAAGLTAKADKTELDAKANAADLGTLAVKNAVGTTDITDASITKAKLATDIQTSLDKAENALTSADMSNYATTAAVGTALTTKADKTELDAKADKSTTLAGYGITDAMTAGAINMALIDKVDAADLGTLAVKNAVGTTDITDASITKAKLATDIQTSLDKAENALTSADMSNYATTAAVGTALADKANTADLGSLAVKNAVGTTDITDASIVKAKLAADIQASLAKADTALQTGDAPDISAVPSDSKDYVLVVNNGQETWLKIAYPGD